MKRMIRMAIVAALMLPVSAFGQGLAGLNLGSVFSSVPLTSQSLPAGNITPTALAVNRMIAEVHTEATAGTPLATNHEVVDTLFVLGRTVTGISDQVLGGDLEAVLGLTRFMGLDRHLRNGTLLEHSILVAPLTLGPRILADGSGTKIVTTLPGTLVRRFAPLEVLQTSAVPSQGLGLGNGLPLDAVPTEVLQVMDAGAQAELLSGTELPGL